MNISILAILAPIIVLGAAMTIHEFGHFIVARMLKIRVEIFSFIGIGPRVFGFKRGHTDYRLSLIPLGAYVKLGGDETNAAIEGEGASDIPASERFDLRPRWQKFLVIVAGPIFNLVTAFAVVFGAAMLYGVPPTPAPVVKGIRADGAAARSGLRVGDRIVKFNGAENPSWERIRNDALISPEQPLPVTVERDGREIDLTVTPLKKMEGQEVLGVFDFALDYGPYPVVIGSVTDGSAAAEAGIKLNDHLIAINGEQVSDPFQVTEYIERSNGAPVSLTIERDGVRQELSASARRVADGSLKLGIAPILNIPPQPVGLLGAAAYGVNRNLEMLRVTGNALGQVFSGKRSARDTISGPIGIVKVTSQAARELGWVGIFTMLGFISLNLGILNLLPIPILDGGAIVILGVEWLLGVVGIGLSTVVRERIQQVGFVLLLMLMVFAFGNDILKLFA
ncbi:MAG: RIP metalloprotease RseP [Pyrinomonadaceae bacterium MAG19_C2-C3]|nr:RIP metalloprotease RseP [Pyrinomonadaceae bacterium MAG19_C2-C3]